MNQQPKPVDAGLVVKHLCEQIAEQAAEIAKLKAWNETLEARSAADANS